MTNSKSQINLNFQAQMTETILSEILVIGVYLEFGLPARSRSGGGRYLIFGASPSPTWQLSNF
jgi:hypothetical protein